MAHPSPMPLPRTIIMNNKLYCFILLLTLLFPPRAARANGNLTFQNITTNSGLSNSQVNSICSDRDGHIWLATQSGLNRFDGFRYKVYHNDPQDARSLKNNFVDKVFLAADGRLWAHTGSGYCVYDARTEKFDDGERDMLRQWAIDGYIEHVAADEKGLLWIAVPGKGIYHVDPTTGHHRLLPEEKGRRGGVTCMAARGGRLMVCYNDGRMKLVNTPTLKTLWKSTFPSEATPAKTNYVPFIDDEGNLWVSTQLTTAVFDAKSRRWMPSVRDFLTARGYAMTVAGTMVVKGMARDGHGTTWLATEHLGLLRIDKAAKSVTQYTYDSADPSSVANNTLQCVYVDQQGALWVGCYKNGVSYCLPSQAPFTTIGLGDVCTIAEDARGMLWCGTDNNGIIAYDRQTGTTQHYDRALTRLGSNAVVSSLAARDGSLWFGTYNGGMARWKDGQWTAMRADGKSGLANDNIWTLDELPDGRIVIGTLGSGLQILDPKTGKMVTYNGENSRLVSNFISSVFVGKGGKVLVAQADNCSVLDLKTGTISKLKDLYPDAPVIHAQINQLCEDSRGIIWMATTNGTIAFDPATGQTSSLNWQTDLIGGAACGVAEDADHNVWIVSDHGLTCVRVVRMEKQWSFLTTSYSSLDGLQPRQFNYRSIALLRRGELAVGGQGGVNVIPRQSPATAASHAKATFSGLLLFNQQLAVGDEYDGHRVMKESLEASGSLRLRAAENVFTILLGTSEAVIPENTRFMYRLKGFSDKWLLTHAEQGSITFTGLPHGHYVLEVKPVNRQGIASDNISTLDITIDPPLYLSWWAMTGYAALALAVMFYIRSVVIRRQRMKLKIQKIEMEAERARQIDEMKLSFFTNISHELRTPLTLIVTPLSAMIKQEADPNKQHTLQIMYNNAQRLLGMVSEVLDLRKIDSNKDKLKLAEGDVVAYIKYITDEVRHLYDKDVDISFTPAIDHLVMDFDADKLRKMVDNLLSNALKYTPRGGHIDVAVGLMKKGKNEEQSVVIRVADNGKGVSDEDKPHIFDRFYQSASPGSNVKGGSGVGLNIVQHFAQMHGGSVAVGDNPGGGALFTIMLPVRTDSSVQKLPAQYAGNATPPAEERKTSEEPVATTEGPAKREVLIVDDNTDFLDFMVGELQQHFLVRTATNGREALNRINEHRPDLILSDVMMPEMDGNELCRHLKASKDTRQIPIIMLTARLADEHHVESMQCGADDYLTKPFNLDLLYLRMENLIKWHNATPEEKAGKTQAELKPMVVTSMDQKLLKKAAEYVDSNIHDGSITVETMAQALGISRVHLYKKLVSITGSTPSEFIRQIRVRRGEQLLRESQMTVSEVAYAVGFNVPRYFAKYFKEMYGVNPSEYRN